MAAVATFVLLRWLRWQPFVLVLLLLGTSAWSTMVVLLLAAAMIVVRVLSWLEALAWMTMVLL